MDVPELGADAGVGGRRRPCGQDRLTPEANGYQRFGTGNWTEDQFKEDFIAGKGTQYVVMADCVPNQPKEQANVLWLLGNGPNGPGVANPYLVEVLP